MSMDYIELTKKIENCTCLYIYGAGVIGYGVLEAAKELFGKKAKAFIVSDKHNNSNNYAGIEVIDYIEYSKKMNKGDLIIVATPPEYHKDIENTLGEIHCIDYELITPNLEYSLMGAYLKKTEKIVCIEDLEYSTETIPTDAKVYMAVSHNDKSLKNKYIEEKYVEKIQVGKVDTNLICNEAVIYDDYKDNISGLNSLYGELTATYNIWKNYDYDIKGIFHYRRTLDVKSEQLSLFTEGKIDVILPLPFVCYPDASGQYGRYLCTEDINIMKEVLFENHPELKDEIMNSLNSPLLYNYNILIARKEVFNDYCEWLFPLLEEITVRCEKVQRNRLPRYIGRIGEVLTSLFFTLNKRNWKIIHAPKIWRV